MRLRLLAITCSILLALGLTATLAAGPGPGDQPPVADVFVESAPLPDRTGGPDLFGYTFADSAEPNCTPVYVPISTTGTALNLADDGEANVTMPFNFVFYGVTSADLRVGNNGGVRFNATTGDVSNGNVALPNATHALTFFPFWDDIDADTGNVYYATVGTAPNRQFIIEWYNRPHFSNVGSATFEMILYETTNRIEFVYPDTTFGNASYDNGVSATVGINQDGTNALQYSYNTAGSIPDGLGICWYPPAPGPLYSTARKSAPIAVVGGEPITYTLYVANTGQLTGTATTIVDPIPTGTTYIAGSVTGGATYNAGLNQIEWSGSIGVGAAVTITFAVDPAGATCGGEVSNTAVISDPAILMPVSRSATTGIWDAAWTYDFEADDGGFVAGVNGGTGGTDWQWGTPTYPVGLVPHSGVNLWATILNGPFNNRGGSSTLTKTFNLPAFASAELSWWQYLKTGNSTFDYGRVFLNSDVVYNSTGVDELVWTNHTANLAPYLGGTLTVNFDFYATTVVNNDGWYLDDVAILACAPPGQVILSTSTKAGTATVPTGGEIDYTLTLNNTGGVAGSGTTLVDPIPAGTTYVAGSATGGATYNSGLNQIEWTGDVPAMGSYVVGFAVTAPSTGGNVVNTATISQTTIAAPVIVSATTNVYGVPEIQLSASEMTSTQLANVIVNQTLTIDNIGTADLDWDIVESGALEGWGAAWETMAPLPSARVFEAVVGNGPYLYAIGGTSDAGATTPTNTNFRYNTATNAWDTMTAMPASLYSVDGIAIDGKIYIPGGQTGSSTYDATTYVYDIAGNSWTSIATSGGYTGRSQYQVVAIGTNLYVLGGITAGASTTQVWTLDTTTGTWSAGMPMQRSRTSFSAGAINGVIYAAGGVAYPGFTPDLTAEKFEGGVWSYIASVPTGGGAYTRWSYNADAIGPDGLWLAAGRRDTDWAVLNHAGVYNPATDTWTDSPTVPVLSQGRVYLEGDTAGDGYFYAMGGRDSGGTIIYASNERLQVVTACAPGDMPWLTVAPTSGTILPGASQDVTVGFDSTGLAVGVYTGTLCVNSNDPVLPQIELPVTLTVRAPTSVSVTDVTAATQAGLLPIAAAALVAITATGVIVLRRRLH